MPDAGSRDGSNRNYRKGPRRDPRTGPSGNARKGSRGHSSAKSHVSPARRAALQCLFSIQKRDAFAQDVLEKHVDHSSLTEEDKAFATKLVLGVVAMQSTLDALIDKSLRSPSDVQDDVRASLRLSAYEIIYLGKSAHAAVDQGVELVKSFQPKAAGLANAVLRRIVDMRSSFPFGNPQTDDHAAALLFGFPSWLMERLVEELGHDEALRFAATSAEAAPAFVAINPLRTDENTLEVLRAARGEPQPAGAGGIQPQGCFALGNKRALADGRVSRLSNRGNFFVCDAASQAVASLVLPDKKPSSLLEIGAGRGNKTLLLQMDAFRNYGSQVDIYFTVDLHRFKAKVLTERAEQFDIKVTEALTGDATDLASILASAQSQKVPRTFDAVFIDAPCTGLGTLRRHPEIRTRLRPDTSSEYAALGLHLLEAAAPFVSPGGTLVYATCTITSEENASLVAAFLRSEAGSGFKLVPIHGAPCFASVLSPGSADAHFAAKMVKSAE